MNAFTVLHSVHVLYVLFLKGICRFSLCHKFCAVQGSVLLEVVHCGNACVKLVIHVLISFSQSAD